MHIVDKTNPLINVRIKQSRKQPRLLYSFQHTESAQRFLSFLEVKGKAVQAQVQHLLPCRIRSRLGILFSAVVCPCHQESRLWPKGTPSCKKHLAQIT